jgi:hypothetical protein
MFKMLIDTCVWLDLAKDIHQQPLLTTIEELVKQKQITLIVPRTILDEFQRNKARIVEDGSRSLSNVFKRVKEAVNKFGDPKMKQAVMEQLNDVDHKIPLLGESIIESVTRIEKLLTGSTITELSDNVKLRAAQRAIDGKAPFHLQKNSINDAILIETYSDFLQGDNPGRLRFAFVTHNIKDFSDKHGNNKNPHPDIASCFSKIRSLYFINLAEAVHRVKPELVSEMMIEEGWFNEPRGLTEIAAAENEIFEKVWYDRHQILLDLIKSGKHKIVETSSGEYIPNTTTKEIMDRAKEVAKNVEETHGLDNLGPWDDFHWGMLNGKLSTLRWVLGDEWDNLDS